MSMNFTVRRSRRRVVVVFALLILGACASNSDLSQNRRLIDPFDDAHLAEESDYIEGEIFDQLHTPEEYLAMEPIARGPVPNPPQLLKDPRIVISLEGLTARLYDAAGTFERVYPVGVGVRDETGRSITPTGNYATHRDRSNRWYYIYNRFAPDYFAGLPFLRLNIPNSSGAHTYALHGPISEPLRRGYVSHGCIRMRPEDVQEIFQIVYHSKPGAPVRVQQEPDRFRSGAPIELEYPFDASYRSGPSTGS